MSEVLGYEYIDCPRPEGGDGVVKAEYSDVICKYCGSDTGILRYGTYKRVQRWWCKKCGRKFVDNGGLPRMRTPVEQVGLALTAFYSGTSLSKIRAQIDQLYDTRPSDGTIYPWIKRWSQVAIDETKDLKPKVGDEWVADETVLQIGGRNVWFWDIMDSKTRFLLASHMSVTRSSRDAKILMEAAAKRAGKAPKVVITDKLLAYIDGMERTFGSDSKHIQSQGFAAEPNTNLIERLHGSIKDRTKVMRGLKSIPSAYLFMDGWSTYYNFFRTHDSLGKTPAEEAGIDSPLKTWLDVAMLDMRPKGVIQTSGFERARYEFPHGARHKSKKHGRYVSATAGTVRGL